MDYKIALARQRRNKRIYKKVLKFFAFRKWTPKKFEKIAFRFTPAMLVLIGMLIFNISPTNAYFNDTESSSGNTFSAGTLDVSLSNTDTYSSGLMYPGDATTTSISISNSGTLDSQYIASTTPVGNDMSACNYVTMTATIPHYSYTGPIKDFISPATTTTDAAWNYSFTISPTAPPSVWEKTCFFKWTYTAWQDSLLNSSSGFSSIKEKLGFIRIGKAIVLNEILPDPNTGSPAPANKEFIELFNNSNISINVMGWQVSEMSGSTEQKYTITTSTSGPYRAVPYDGSTNILSKGWIVLLLSDGTALNNGGDTVRLYDFDGSNKLDEFIYFPPGKPKGFSYARIPDGVGSWVDPIPTPGWTNDFSEIFETILGTTTEEIVFSATTISSMGSEQTEIIASTTSEIIATTTEPIATTTENVIFDNTTSSPEVILEIVADPTAQMAGNEPLRGPRVISETTFPSQGEGVGDEVVIEPIPITPE